MVSCEDATLIDYEFVDHFGAIGKWGISATYGFHLPGVDQVIGFTSCNFEQSLHAVQIAKKEGVLMIRTPAICKSG